MLKYILMNDTVHLYENVSCGVIGHQRRLEYEKKRCRLWLSEWMTISLKEHTN